jgi:hypothetical protein
MPDLGFDLFGYGWPDLDRGFCMSCRADGIAEARHRCSKVELLKFGASK